jgi:hypothetical protein
MNYINMRFYVLADGQKSDGSVHEAGITDWTCAGL